MKQRSRACANTRSVKKRRALTLGFVGALGACGAPETTPVDSAATPSSTTTTTATEQSTTGANVIQTQPAARMPAAAMVAGQPGMAPAGMNNQSPVPTQNTHPSGIMPCGVSKVLAAKCQNCHGASPVGGAPMPLVTFADLHVAAKTQPNMKVYEVSKLRIHDAKQPMPPIGSLEPADIATLDTWFDAGALTTAMQDSTCEVSSIEPALGPGSQDGTHGRLVPKAGETCYEFKVHQSTTSVDDEPFIIESERYEQFYYKTPWPADTVATSYATIADNAAVLHHWLFFSTNEQQPEGAHITAPIPTLIGTEPVLLTGWAVGGPNLEMPADVGMELPNPGRTMNVQWHFYNSTGQPQKDASAVQICTVPRSMRANVGAVTWAGTEDLNGNVWSGGPGMPPNKESTFTTTCRPRSSNIPIQIIGFEPHMHRIGKRMKTEVNHLDGTKDVLFDEPFSFGNETHYFRKSELKPGETLTTSCTFFNDNTFGVPFGESTDSEMCYQFTFHYPAHALSNGAFSLLGVTDTCW